MPSIKIAQFGVVIKEGTSSHKLETALEPVTEEMNRTPLRVNRATWLRNKQALEQKFRALEAKCREMTGNPKFRANASADCVTEFVDVRGLTPLRKTGSGKFSIDKEQLETFAHLGDELAPVVIEAREARTVLSQLEAWEPYADKGYVRAVWNQYGTPHGRYS